MPAKCGKVPERCCVHFPRVGFLTTRIRQDRASSEAPEIARSATPRARTDIGGEEGARKPGVNEFPQVPPQEGTAITISVIEGSSKGLTYQMGKSCITVGRIGGGADFEFDDPEACNVHCIVATRPDGVRIYDGASTTGVYVNDQRISTIELKHMSTFRVGSSLFQVSVLPNCQRADIG